MIFIQVKDIARIFNVSTVTANRRYNVMKSALRKKEHQKILLDEFCSYEGLDKETVKKTYFSHLLSK